MDVSPFRNLDDPPSKHKLTQLSIDKTSVADVEAFKCFVDLSNLVIIGEEPGYYILDGPEEDLETFKNYWNS